MIDAPGVRGLRCSSDNKVSVGVKLSVDISISSGRRKERWPFLKVSVNANAVRVIWGNPNDRARAESRRWVR